MKRLFVFLAGLFGPRERRYEERDFYFSSKEILEKLEKRAKLPEGDLSLRGEARGVTYPEFLDVSSYSIYSQTYQKGIGSFRHAKNPVGPGGTWSSRRRKLEEVAPDCHELKAPFAGGGSITIVR
ncbi:MAG: hypothetical protein Q7K44_00065 [Candidatus Liptonbacteria bacterium]|nr:hypothetical protein [Candidatus Liptonbacteria bacterium]